MSTGNFGGSINVLELNPEGDVWNLKSQTKVDPQYFGMGLTTVGMDTYMVTWKAQKVLKYSLDDLMAFDDGENADNAASGAAAAAGDGTLTEAEPEILDLPSSMKQGWGLSHDDLHGKLYISDGTDSIKIVDPRTMETTNRIRVRDEHGDEPILNLNELEVVDDKWIFANQFTENMVYQIRISTGRVVRSWDLSALQWR